MAETNTKNIYGWTTTAGCSVATAQAPSSNFKLLEDEPGKSVYVENVETPLDQREKITITAGTIPTVANGLDIVNPNKVSTGVTFAVKVEETARYTDGQSMNVDDPVVVQISVRHTLDSKIDRTALDAALARALGLLYENTSTQASSTNLDRLQRGSTKLLG